MRARAFSVIIFTLAFVLAWSLFSGVCDAQKQVGAGMGAQPMYNVPEEKKKQWEGIQNMAEKEYNVCREHCGGDAACLDKCKKAYESKLDRGYRDLTNVR